MTQTVGQATHQTLEVGPDPGTIDQRRPDDYPLHTRAFTQGLQGLLGLPLGEPVGIARTRLIGCAERAPRRRFLTIDLDRTDQHEAFHPGLGSGRGQAQHALDIDRTKGGQRIRGRLVHHMHPRRRMHQHIDAQQRFGTQRSQRQIAQHASLTG